MNKYDIPLEILKSIISNPELTKSIDDINNDTVTKAFEITNNLLERIRESELNQ